MQSKTLVQRVTLNTDPHAEQILWIKLAKNKWEEFHLQVKI